MSPGGKPRLVPGYRAIDFRCPVCKLVLENEQFVSGAKHFDAWEDEPLSDLSFWAEDFGIANLDDEERATLGFTDEPSER